MDRDLLVGAARLATMETARLRVVGDEQGDYLTLDGQRLGRDLQLYAFMGKVAGNELAMCKFLEEVILPLKAALDGPEFAAASAPFRRAGGTVYSGDLLDDWRAFFD